MSCHRIITRSSIRHSFRIALYSTTCALAALVMLSLPHSAQARLPQLPVPAPVPTMAPHAITATIKPPFINTIVPATAPTTGGSIVLVGEGFGINPQVSIGGKACKTVSATSNRVTCNVPAGVGSALQVELIAAGKISNSIGFSYIPPAIASIMADNAATRGGGTLNITGSNFGTVAAEASVKVGNGKCLVIRVTHNAISCVLPAGQGMQQGVVVSVANQVSQPVFFNYAKPQILSVTPIQGLSTAGGSTINITGNNFGITPKVTIGDAVCSPNVMSHTAIRCTVPPGQGVNNTITVEVAGNTTTFSGLSYGIPTLHTISPANGSKAGGINIDIIGANFGSGSATVQIGSANCPVIFKSHTKLRCTLPPLAANAALSQPVMVSVGGQVNEPGLVFGYN